jgi:predicted NBD/HSP70 family sugar kinase
MDFIGEGIAAVTSGLAKRQRDRIAGIGVASPFELWNWEEEIGAPRGALEQWRTFDLAAEIAAVGDWPVKFSNDATAACAAELFFGKGSAIRDFAYFYIGFFIGGGIVLNGTLFQGHTGNAGAMGTIPVPSATGTEQLIRHASLYVLENMVADAGLDPQVIGRAAETWAAAGAVLDRWIAETAASLAHAALAATAVLDLEAVIIDGALPAEVRARLVAAVRDNFTRLDSRGIAALAILEGSIGRDARAMGAASLPLFANYMIDRDVLFKETG